jgi:hypothetical protein
MARNNNYQHQKYTPEYKRLGITPEIVKQYAQDDVDMYDGSSESYVTATENPVNFDEFPIEEAIHEDEIANESVNMENVENKQFIITVDSEPIITTTEEEAKLHILKMLLGAHEKFNTQVTADRIAVYKKLDIGIMVSLT